MTVTSSKVFFLSWEQELFLWHLSKWKKNVQLVLYYELDIKTPKCNSAHTRGDSPEKSLPDMKHNFSWHTLCHSINIFVLIGQDREIQLFITCPEHRNLYCSTMPPPWHLHQGVKKKFNSPCIISRRSGNIPTYILYLIASTTHCRCQQIFVFGWCPEQLVHTLCSMSFDFSAPLPQNSFIQVQFTYNKIHLGSRFYILYWPISEIPVTYKCPSKNFLPRVSFFTTFT